jgi:hypothetical protein
MSKLTDQLAEHQCDNGHNFASAAAKLGGGSVYITYRTQMTGRAYQCAAWQVVDVKRPTDTDPSRHWRDYGHQTFNVYEPRKQKASQRDAAIAWAAEYTNTAPADWVPGPFSGTVVLKSDRLLVLERLLHPVGGRATR